jgi:hypothetical protein
MDNLVGECEDSEAHSWWLISAGNLHRPFLDLDLRCECSVYLLAQETLSPLRKFSRRCTKHSLSPKGPTGLLSRVLIPSSIPLEHNWNRVCTVKSTSRSYSGCLGGCCVGSSARCPTLVLLLQSRACAGILAFPAYLTFRPQTKRHHCHRHVCSTATFSTAHIPAIELFRPGQRLSIYL